MKDLIKWLNDRTKEYDEGNPTVSDREWDEKYFQLIQMEKELGYSYPNSPSQIVNYEVVNKLEKVEHNHKMLSLDKTKNISDIISFVENQEYIAMCKMDGLTCSLRYLNGELVSAETRGNGLIGENILHNARVVSNIPNKISYLDELIIDGEIICTEKDFAIVSSEYKNSRNFAAGSIRLLDANECKKRNLTFIAWDIINGFDEYILLSDKLQKIKNLGFTIVPYLRAISPKEHIVNELITINKEMAYEYGYPIDGIVFKFDNISYGKSLGETSHHFKNAIAYKFYDETYSTNLINIEWSMGRTGQISPIAIFNPVEIDGTEIERASLHNISVLKETLHGMGWKNQKIEVSKRNMIIPQIEWAEEDDEHTKEYLSIPAVCPICGHATEIRKDIDSEVLYCKNLDCEGKLINRLDHFCGKKGLDIRGLSKATLEKLLNWNFIEDCSSIFKLKEFKSQLIKKPGFGIKSVENILNAIENSRQCELSQFIAALGIPLIGTTAAKELTKYFKTWEDFIEAVEKKFNFYTLPNFGLEMYRSILNFNYDEAKYIANTYLNFNTINQELIVDSNIKDKTFVITGKINYFKNRDELKTKIETMGGKVVGSISKNTSYLISNDSNSASSKTKQAKQLNIPIITEDEFLKILEKNI